jgi:hypothetical protein
MGPLEREVVFRAHVVGPLAVSGYSLTPQGLHPSAQGRASAPWAGGYNSFGVKPPLLVLQGQVIVLYPLGEILVYDGG